jgi:predicted CXXCH cytochrome family protein
MVRPATPEGVKGDFTRGKIELRGDSYVLEAKGGQYFITESRIVGKKTRHRVLYTLGNRRIQHYLTALADGRVVVLAPSWDVLRKEWFHNMEIVGREPEAGIAVQVWNMNCFGCHVSQEERHFDLASKTYDTDWVDFGTSCERCHGPGGDHVDLYTRQNGGGASGTGSGSGSEIVVQTKLDNVKNTMVCAQCHSLRDTIEPGFTAGEDYFDYFLPSLEYGLPRGEDPAWYVDGKTRRFSSNTLGIWQSRCFLEGKLACTNCHRDAHDPEIEKNAALRPDHPALCTGCHEAIGRNVSAHTHHDESSAGSSCVECHMPRSVVSIKAKIRDHSLSLPTPENTESFGIPNACNICHEDKTPSWAAETIDGWFPGARGRRQKLIDRAEAFTRAREGAPDAVDRLLALEANESEPPLVRANAVGYLGRYGSDPRTMPALLRALGSREPVLRVIAAPQLANVGAARLASVKPFLVRALADDRRVVRMGAAFSLLSLGVQHLDGDDGVRFEDAKRIYVTRAATSPDHAPTQLELGKFYLMNKDLEDAAKAFEASLHLDPGQKDADYYRAIARLGEGRTDEAKDILKRIGEDSSFHAAAKALLLSLSKP